MPSDRTAVRNSGELTKETVAAKRRAEKGEYAAGADGTQVVSSEGDQKRRRPLKKTVPTRKP